MNKELKEIIEKLNNTDSKEIELDAESLRKVMGMFSVVTEAENHALITAASEKLAEVFTLDTLKSMDQRFIPTEMLNLLISANTVSSYDIISAFQALSEDDLPPLIVLMFSLKLCDDSEIIVIDVQEEEDEAD